MTTPLISSTEVEHAFVDCLYTTQELAQLDPGEPPRDMVVVESVTAKYGFHPQRLETHRGQVRQWLTDLPVQFQAGSGGGFTFLQACNDRNGMQWTDFHKRVDQLFALGLGLKLVESCLPRSMWSVLPGGVPYFVVYPDGVPTQEVPVHE